MKNKISEQMYLLKFFIKDDIKINILLNISKLFLIFNVSQTKTGGTVFLK